MKKTIATGIVSEIRSATLVKSDNPYLNYPCIVLVHVMERDVNGNISVCTVSTGSSFVAVKNAEFENMSEILPLKYGEINQLEEYKRLHSSH